MQEGIGTIITAIDRSRKIFRRLESYIIYRLASSYLILVVFFVLIIVWDFEMQTWALVLISMFNDLAVMLTAFDKVVSMLLRHSRTKCSLGCAAIHWDISQEAMLSCYACRCKCWAAQPGQSQLCWLSCNCCTAHMHMQLLHSSYAQDTQN